MSAEAPAKAKNIAAMTDKKTLRLRFNMGLSLVTI
jgi:hypothetical protein